MEEVIIEIPLRTWSEANVRRHWAARARRTKIQREAARLCLLGTPEFRRMDKTGSIEIMLTRIAPRELDDDNLTSAMKGVRDGVADALERNDRDKSLHWAYSQRKGKPKEYSILVIINAGATNISTESRRCSV